MKFELPLDMVLVQDTPQVNHTYNSRESLLDGIDEKTISKHDNMTQLEEFFKSMELSISSCTQVRLDRLETSDSNSISPYVKQLENDRRLGRANIDFLRQKLKKDLDEQEAQVTELLEAEKRRIILEEERRIAEAERKKKEEEAKKQREEEERKKKALEKIRLEEEKKKAAEEAKKMEEAKKRAEEVKKRAQLEEERKQKEAQKQLEAEKQAEKEKLEKQQNFRGTSFSSVQKDFLKYRQDIEDIKTNVVQKVASDPELKKAVSQLKRKINPKFGQLSQSNQQFQRINGEVINLIATAKSAPLAFNWILNFVAKAIVDQAETEVIVQSAAAVPLAKLAYSLLQQFPELEYYLNARFIKKCPLIIGFSRSIDTEEGRIQMGWKRRDNKWEDEVKYDERLSGICTVWATMTTFAVSGTQFSLYGLDSSWKFLARLMNTDVNLLSNVHFSVAANWWEAASKSLLQIYGNQANKLLYTLTVALTNSVRDKKYPAAARLLILGEEWFQNRKIEGLPEMTN